MNKKGSGRERPPISEGSPTGDSKISNPIPPRAMPAAAGANRPPVRPHVPPRPTPQAVTPAANVAPTRPAPPEFKPTAPRVDTGLPTSRLLNAGGHRAKAAVKPATQGQKRERSPQTTPRSSESISTSAARPVPAPRPETFKRQNVNEKTAARDRSDSMAAPVEAAPLPPSRNVERSNLHKAEKPSTNNPPKKALPPLTRAGQDKLKEWKLKSMAKDKQQKGESPDTTVASPDSARKSPGNK
jgi:hypothetical protein